MDQVETLGTYSVDQNEKLSCFFVVMEFKMAAWAQRLYKTYISP